MDPVFCVPYIPEESHLGSIHHVHLCRIISPLQRMSTVVGGFNPVEKYWLKMGNLPQVGGEHKNMFENHHLVWYLQRMLVLQLHHAWNQKPKKQPNMEKQWNTNQKSIQTGSNQTMKFLLMSNLQPHSTTPVAGAAVVAAVAGGPAVGAAAASGAAIGSSSSAWSGPMGGPKNPRTWLTFGGNGCVLCFVFFFLEEEIKSMKFYSVSSNLRDRDWNSASEIDGFDVKVRSVSTLWMMREQTTSQILAESFHVNRLAISIAKWLLCRYSWKSERGGGEIKSWK